MMGGSNRSGETRIGRRAVLKGSALVLGTGTGALGPWHRFQCLQAEETSKLREDSSVIRIGMVTDLHYADKPAAGSRHYRESVSKLQTAASTFAEEKPDMLVELGDLIDAADSVPTELGYLQRINRDFSAICPVRHYVLGNHCVHTLTKAEFLGAVEQPRSFYSFDSGGIHFVILDSCFRSDGQPYGRGNFQWTDANIPRDQVDWLDDDLQRTTDKTIVFAHQRLDVENHYGVRNASQVRNVLEKAGNVRAVFQGHSHKNDYREIGGIHYCTLVAMVEGSGREQNAFSTLCVDDSGEITVKGFLKQQSYQWQV